MEHLLEVLKILDGAVSADRQKVQTYAEQLAQKLADAGDKRAAEGIRRTLQKTRGPELASARMSPGLPVDGESRFALADEHFYARGTVKVVFRAHTEERIAEFIRYIQGADQLLAHGVGIAPSLLIYGPPGCGKTELAKYIASELQLPLLTARTDALISSYLGNTAKNIRNLFDHAVGRPCVLFLDEFDALAKLRDDQHELGELKRVVVSLLQVIDALDSKTILIAATNHEHLLDSAIWRRFSFRIEVGPPETEAREDLLKTFLSEHAPPTLDLSHLAGATDGMTGAELRMLCEEARRGAILNRQSVISEGDLLLRLARIRIPKLDSMPVEDRIVAVRRLDHKTFTIRRVAEMFSVSTGKVSVLASKKGQV